MTQSVQASGPISFTNSSGRQFYIPLDIISIDANGSVVLPSTYQPDDKAAMTKWLQYLFAIGEIVAVPAPAPIALDLVAKAAGPGGDGITADIAYVSGTETYAITAKQVNVFSPLTGGDVAATVNALAGGLIQVTASSGYEPPYEQTLTAAEGELTTGSELVLATAAAGPGAAHVGVLLDPGGPTLTVQWSDTVSIVPPTSLPPPAGERTQQEQIAEAFSFISVTSSADVAAAGAVLVPQALAETQFDAAKHTLALQAATGTALTLTAVPPTSSDTKLKVSSKVSAKVVVNAASYDLTITRTDKYSGANLTPDKLAAAIGTTGTPPATGTVTGGLVVLRANGATPPASFDRVPPDGAKPARLVVRGQDGRYEIGLAPGSGLAIAPAVTTLGSKGTWSITARPQAGGTFSIEASWTHSGEVDASRDVPTQQAALAAALDGLIDATPHALLLPQGGGYSLGGGTGSSAARISIPARTS